MTPIKKPSRWNPLNLLLMADQGRMHLAIKVPLEHEQKPARLVSFYPILNFCH